MEGEKGIGAPNSCDEMGEIFSEFLAEVVKFEESVTIGRRYLICFQQALEFLRHPSIQETCEMVNDILKVNETERIKTYILACCVNVYDTSQNVTKMSTSLVGLQDHLTKAEEIVNELANLKEKAGDSLQAATQSEKTGDRLETGEFASKSAESLDMADYGSFMAVIYDMVKQDYVMQDRIVSSLNLKSSVGELDSYILMWSLRPYVNDDMIHQALRYKIHNHMGCGSCKGVKV